MELHTARSKHDAALTLLERVLGAPISPSALVPPPHEPLTPHTCAHQIDIWAAEDVKRAEQIRFVVETRYQHALLQRLQDEGLGEEVLEKIRNAGQKAGRKYKVGRRFGMAIKDENFMKVIRGGLVGGGDGEKGSCNVADGRTSRSAAAPFSPLASGKRKREAVLESYVPNIVRLEPVLLMLTYRRRIYHRSVPRHLLFSKHSSPNLTQEAGDIES